MSESKRKPPLDVWEVPVHSTPDPYSCLNHLIGRSCAVAEVGNKWYNGPNAPWNLPQIYTYGYVNELPELPEGREYLLLDNFLITWDNA